MSIIYQIKQVIRVTEANITTYIFSFYEFPERALTRSFQAAEVAMASVCHLIKIDS